MVGSSTIAQAPVATEGSVTMAVLDGSGIGVAERDAALLEADADVATNKFAPCFSDFVPGKAASSSLTKCKIGAIVVIIHLI